jgi:hypothetical protein
MYSAIPASRLFVQRTLYKQCHVSDHGFAASSPGALNRQAKFGGEGAVGGPELPPLRVAK